MKLIEELKDDSLSPELCAHITRLWKEDALKLTFRCRNQFQIDTSASYALDNIDRIMGNKTKESGQISFQDILHARVRTTGIVETEANIGSLMFLVRDVGGPRNERKKWIHCFENLSIIMFVVGLGEYDGVLYEDDDTNRLKEDLDLWEDIVNSRWFTTTPFLLLMNKYDIFEEKIPEIPLRDYLPSYTGENSVHACYDFIVSEFMKRIRGNKDRIFVHHTNALNSEQMKQIFGTIPNVLEKCLPGFFAPQPRSESD